MAHVRTVRTASGATAVQIVHSSRRGSGNIEHLGSAHDEAELEALKAAAAQRLAAGQGELDLGFSTASKGGPLEITASRAEHLWEALCRAYDALGFDAAAARDEVFRVLVLARIIEPTSKLDSLRVLAETGIAGPSYPTLKRHLPGYVTESAAGVERRLRRPHGLGARLPGALRGVDVVLRDRCRSRVLRRSSTWASRRVRTFSALRAAVGPAGTTPRGTASSW